ncbi:MAG: SOS response-associated peptidase [Terrimicrobiaceae bacterium]
MCGRYVLGIPPEDLAEFFELSEIRLSYRPRFNVAPTTPILVIKEGENGSREAVEMRWGLIPSWTRPGDRLSLLINARAETVATKPAYREAFARRRCLIPASGYYEWQKLPAGAKQPFFITRKDNLPMAFAGIWEGATQANASAAIITTQAAGETRAIHDRMPATVATRDWRRWLAPVPLTGEESRRILSAHEEGSLRASPVSTRVNSARNDDPGLIEPI